MTATGDPATRVRLGVSSCLLGERVRYDGRDKHEPYLTGALGDRVRWLPVCPELDIGLGVPREPIHLLAGPGEVRLAGVESGHEHTVAMRGYAERRVDQLERAGLDGYVLKARSPSCGLDGVPVHDPVAGEVVGHDRGRFAAVLVDRIPDLPVIEEAQLAIPDVRDRFLERACVRHRWRRQLDDPSDPDALVELHARHEMQVRAHAPGALRDLGVLAADAAAGDRQALRSYRRCLHAALDVPTTRDRHVDVLRRLASVLDDDGVHATVDRYATGDSPWTEVATHVREAAASGSRLASQTYLDPLAEVELVPATW